MPDEKKPSFVVNDRRKINFFGEAIDSDPNHKSPDARPEAGSGGPQSVEPSPSHKESEAQVSSPSVDEQNKQADRYNERSREFDARLEKELKAHGDRRTASDFEMTFDKLVASLYMTALMQLGLVHQENEKPHADLIGARQTIDTLSILSEKTKGNLTNEEQTVLTNCLYEVRMAYVELTSAIAHAPSGVVPPGPGGAGKK
ncbi:MAG TPA: DUF1844 domain-containing protein [Candidatus Acidoferrales bacterium]|nr:DUF1844 domain-containing protein [Candidatus Acidoferrales bacterium]